MGIGKYERISSGLAKFIINLDGVVWEKRASGQGSTVSTPAYDLLLTRIQGLVEGPQEHVTKLLQVQSPTFCGLP